MASLRSHRSKRQKSQRAPAGALDEITHHVNNPTDLTPSDLPCDECGRFDTLEIAGRHLCPDCIATAACGCAGPADCTDD